MFHSTLYFGPYQVIKLMMWPIYIGICETEIQTHLNKYKHAWTILHEEPWPTKWQHEKTRLSQNYRLHPRASRDLFIITCLWLVSALCIRNVQGFVRNLSMALTTHHKLLKNVVCTKNKSRTNPMLKKKLQRNRDAAQVHFQRRYRSTMHESI